MPFVLQSPPAVEAPAPVPLFPGAVIDCGVMVRSEQVVWPPKDRHDQVVNGWIYQIRHADGSLRRIPQVNGRYFPDGTEVVVTFGSAFRVENARTYRAPPAPSADQLAKREAATAAGFNTVDEVLVTARRETPPISELAERATGKEWNNVYCETEVALGSLLPRQRCLTLLGWDLRHQEALRIRADLLIGHGMPGR